MRFIIDVHEGDAEPATVRPHGRDLVVERAGEVRALVDVEAVVVAVAGEAAFGADVYVTGDLSGAGLRVIC